MNLHKHRTGFARLEREVLDSPAFRTLTLMGTRALLDFISFIQWETKQIRKDKISTMVNGKDLKYSFDEAERRGFSRSSFNRALTEIIEHGFLKVRRHGSGLSKDANVYEWIGAWKDYGTPNFKPAERRKSKSGHGFKQGNTVGRQFKPSETDGTILY